MVVDLGTVLDGDHETGDVDHLVGDHDVSLSDLNTGVVERSSELGAEDNGLQSSLEESGHVEGQNVIESIFGLLAEKAELEHPVKEGTSLEYSLGVGLFQGE